jgi:hypothetical protein
MFTDSESTAFDRHGGPYDRGGADAYYERPRCPHYFTGATYMSDKIQQENMTAAEIAAYNLGYDSVKAI